MAFYSENIIQLKTFLLMAWGEKPWKPGRRRYLVLHPKADRKEHPKEINAHGFDMGSLRSSFETHAQARTFLKDIQSGKYEINQFRHIDPQSIRIHEMVYEAQLIGFTDEENEIIP